MINLLGLLALFHMTSAPAETGQANNLSDNTTICLTVSIDSSLWPAAAGRDGMASSSHTFANRMASVIRAAPQLNPNQMRIVPDPYKKIPKCSDPNRNVYISVSYTKQGNDLKSAYLISYNGQSRSGERTAALLQHWPEPGSHYWINAGQFIWSQMDQDAANYLEIISDLRGEL